MELEKTAVLDGVNWQQTIVFATKSPDHRQSNWESAVLAAVFFLHATLIAYGYHWEKELRSNTLSEDEALQVSFIDRITVPGIKLSDSVAKKNRAKDSARPLAPAVLEETAPRISESTSVEDGRALRLTMDVDEWKSESVTALRDPLKRQFIALPGRAEPFIRGIKLANSPTPEQRLKQLGKLFGAVEYDACKEARHRMASGQSQVSAFDLEHDLRNIERHCRP